MRNTRSILIAATLFTAGATGGFIGLASAARSDLAPGPVASVERTPSQQVGPAARAADITEAAAARSAAEPTQRAAAFPVDVDGDGQISARGAEQFPELLLVVGDTGQEGYVRFADMVSPEPRSPEEALAQMSKTRVLPVYDETGTRQIDTFTIRPASDVTTKTDD